MVWCWGGCIWRRDRSGWEGKGGRSRKARGRERARPAFHGTVSHGFNANGQRRQHEEKSPKEKEGRERQRRWQGKGRGQGSIDRRTSSLVSHGRCIRDCVASTAPSIEAHRFGTSGQCARPWGSDRKPLGRPPVALKGPDGKCSSKIPDISFHEFSVAVGTFSMHLM